MSFLIEFQGISKIYYRGKDPGIHALKHINFSVAKGEIFGIIGLSGAGKSTLLRCLATLEKPTLGKIYLKGQEITSLNGQMLRNVRKQMGVIFQDFNLFSSRTVWKNIAYPLEIANVAKEEKERRIAELLALVGLKEQKNAYPAQLSGGQKQRVGIARALANEPEILLCDEATSALDPKTTRDILTLIQDLQQKLDLTVVLITHEMEVVKQICNKVAVIEKGEIVEMGTIAEIFIEPKHEATKKFVEKTIHDVPENTLSEKGKVFHLHFKGKKAEQPIITQMIKKYDVDVNILLGWVDSLQTVTVGNLIVEITGDALEDAIAFLKQQEVRVEERTSGK